MRLLTRNHLGEPHVTSDLTEDKTLPQYAVLSHTWGGIEDEVTMAHLNDGRAIERAGYKKLTFCLEQAERDGLQYCWVDTCCIDKTNQVELGKAIVSMFRWYKNAHKCYVYLADVSVSNIGTAADLRRSRWFHRGWTLQELLAPLDVILFNAHGACLGTKASLKLEISQATGIPVVALVSQSFTEFTIQERFSWQSDRDTKEPEDLAYSLWGLFDVSMPVIYGEGYLKARQRLVEYIRSGPNGMRPNGFEVTPALNDVVPVQSFVGRTQEIEAIASALNGSDGRRRCLTIHGLGGMGKTQLTVHYATRFMHSYSTVLWINIDSKDTVTNSFVNIAKHMRSQPMESALELDQSETKPDIIIDAVKTWLSQPYNTRWLMIFDNYDNPKITHDSSHGQVDIRDYLPSAYQGSIIITTRSARVQIGQSLHLTKLQKDDDSLELLAKASGRPGVDTDPYAQLLVREMDGLPLALATAGAYLSQSNMSFERYLQLYRNSWARLQETSSELRTYEDRKLFSTWAVTLERIHEESTNAVNFLRIASYFDNEDIWLGLLQYKGKDVPLWVTALTQSELDFEAALQVLIGYGMVEKAKGAMSALDSSGYSLHRCVHAWAKSHFHVPKDPHLVSFAFRAVAASVPKTTRQGWYLTQRRLLNHASVCTAESAQQRSPTAVDYSWAWNKYGRLYAKQGRLAEAEAMYKRALAGSQETFGSDHPSTLRVLSHLGDLYTRLNRFDEAEKWYNQAIAGKGDVLTTGHMSTLDTVNNLGILYYKQGKYEEAEKTYLRALAGTELARGAEYVSTLSTLNNLGLLYSKQNRLDDAEAIFTRALRDCERAHRTDHLLYFEMKNNLAIVHASRERMDEAEELYKAALVGKRTVLDQWHMSLLNTLDNLGMFYHDQGRLPDAKDMLGQALRGYRRSAVANKSKIMRLERILATIERVEAQE